MLCNLLLPKQQHGRDVQFVHTQCTASAQLVDLWVNLWEQMLVVKMALQMAVNWVHQMDVDLAACSKMSMAMETALMVAVLMVAIVVVVVMVVVVMAVVIAVLTVVVMAVGMTAKMSMYLAHQKAAKLRVHLGHHRVANLAY